MTDGRQRGNPAGPEPATERVPGRPAAGLLLAVAGTVLAAAQFDGYPFTALAWLALAPLPTSRMPPPQGPPGSSRAETVLLGARARTWHEQSTPLLVRHLPHHPAS